MRRLGDVSAAGAVVVVPAQRLRGDGLLLGRRLTTLPALRETLLWKYPLCRLSSHTTHAPHTVRDPLLCAVTPHHATRIVRDALSSGNLL